MNIWRIQIKRNLHDLLGLTNNEAKVYEAFIEKPQFDTLELATLTGLPRTRIYEVLSKLAAKNLLEKLNHGSGYRIIPPSEAFSEYLGKLETDFQNRSASIKELRSYFQSKFTRSLSSDVSPGVSLLPFKEAEIFMLDQIKKVKSRLFIAVATGSRSVDWSKSGNSLAVSYNSDLDVRYLVASETLAKRLKTITTSFAAYKDMKIKFKHNKDLYTSFVILDDIIYLFFLGQKEKTSLETLVLRTASEGLLKSFEWTYKKLWETGSHEL